MSDAAYRKANSGMLSCLGVCALGVVGTAAVGAIFHYFPAAYKTVGNWAVLFLSLPLPVSIVVAGLRLRRLNRERVAKLTPVCATLGFRAVCPSAENAATFFAPLAALQDPLALDGGASRLVWYAELAASDRTERLFEHEFTRGSGKTTQLYPHTVLAWPWSHPDAERRFANETATFSFSRQAGLLRGFPFPHRRTLHTWAGPKTKWAVDGDVGAASRFLTLAVQLELESAPAGEWWYVGSGWVCCVFNGKLDAENLPTFVAHGRTVFTGRSS
jgi:hypothetical protein